MQVNVFSPDPFLGNPVAVVLDGADLSAEQMQQVATWANLSETTFVLPPTEPGADYHVRIFTPVAELPFAGHPTLGTAHAFLTASGSAQASVVQQCAAGLVRVRRAKAGLAFAAPPLTRSGPLEPPVLEALLGLLELEREDVLDAAWADNGPGWAALLLRSAERVLAVRPRPPGALDLKVGVVGAYPAGAGPAYEVRAFFPKHGVMTEDPVTGSLNASVAQWLVGTGRFQPPYMVSQGTALGRAGQVHIEGDDEGGIWVGGATMTVITGSVQI